VSAGAAAGMGAEPTGGQVTFFDLEALLEPAGGGYRLRRDAGGEVLGAGRRGILTNAPPGISRPDIVRVLELAGVDGLFEADLVVIASGLDCPLPDPRAFAVAAALAATSPDKCRFITMDQANRSAALAAGMTVPAVPRGAAAGSTLRTGPVADGRRRAIAAPGLFRAGEIDEDIGPTYVLRGRVVTMDDHFRVHDDARLVVDGGRIARIVTGHAALPAGYRTARLVDVEGTIYPGLIDLHNHYVYNVLPFWPVLKAWNNRTEWARDPAYGAEVSLPIHVLVSSPRASRAIVRYVEAKALIGGTTTGQGIRTQVRGGARLFRGAMRNAEETNDPRLPEAGTRVPNLGRRAVDFAAFAASLVRRGNAGGAYFYHLAEGTNPLARRTFTDLRDHDLLRPSLAGIHALALEAEDLARLATAGSRLVWSPFSNLLLYGKTLDLGALADSKAVFSIGSDWSPTGGKNLLEELKVARFEVVSQGGPFAPRDLVAAVTGQPAKVLGWQGQVGTLAAGALADLLVLPGTTGDPYDRLIDAVEADVRLVVTHGIARYGNRSLVQALTPAGQRVERWRHAGLEQGFQLRAPQSGMDDLSFADARDFLAAAARDLPAFRESIEAERVRSRALGVDPDDQFTLTLDNEPEPAETDGAERAGPLRVDWSQLPHSIEIDEPWVGGGTYWSRLAKQHNLDPALKQMLRDAYQNG
jgi:5-methylthioadenosine/S-adenosylhomocysteine deaminase